MRTIENKGSDIWEKWAHQENVKSIKRIHVHSGANRYYKWVEKCVKEFENKIIETCLMIKEKWRKLGSNRLIEQH